MPRVRTKATKATGRIRAHNFKCQEDGCSYACEDQNTLQAHMIGKHGVGEKLYHCFIPSCNFGPYAQKKGKTKHEASKHPNEYAAFKATGALPGGLIEQAGTVTNNSTAGGSVASGSGSSSRSNRNSDDRILDSDMNYIPSVSVLSDSTNSFNVANESTTTTTTTRAGPLETFVADLTFTRPPAPKCYSIWPMDGSPPITVITEPGWTIPQYTNSSAALQLSFEDRNAASTLTSKEINSEISLNGVGRKLSKAKLSRQSAIQTEYRGSGRFFPFKDGKWFCNGSCKDKENCVWSTSTPTVPIVEEHVQASHGAFKCSQCGTSISTAYDLKKHKKLCGVPISARKVFPCGIGSCSHASTRQTHQLQHQATHDSGAKKMVKCVICLNQQVTLLGYPIHLLLHQIKDKQGKGKGIPGNLLPASEAENQEAEEELERREENGEDFDIAGWVIEVAGED